MLKSIITLPDGTEISSGTGQTNNIRSTALTECVNRGEELTLGSVCANMLEATLQTPSGSLSLTAGTEIILHKETVDGRHQVGVFVLEKPTKPSANLLKIVGYDRVAKLDKDLTSWLKGLDGWPYSLLTFAGMVCQACGLTLATKSIPNGDYPVQQITAEATGRQLMGWIGEVCCRFCRATASGDIELAWYKQAGASIAPSGEHFYFQRGLSFENYEVEPIDAVQLRLSDSDDGALWPAAAEGANSYIINNNPILLAAVTDATRAALQVIEGELEGVTFTPCKASIPATLDIHAGDIVQITDINGVSLSAYVMTKVQKGQKDTLECTGSPRRDSSTAVNNRSPSDAADRAAKNAFAGLTQQQVFDKLTNYGQIQGLYVQDDVWYVNAAVAKVINLSAASITAGILSSADGNSYFDLDNGKIETNNIVATGGTVGCWNINSGGLWTGKADGSVVGVALGKGTLFTSMGSGWRQVHWYQVHDCVSDWVANSSSDAAVKNSVSGIDAYDTMFDRLKPCRYKYNYGTSNRYHTGFIAQEVVEAIEGAGLTTQDFAGVVHLEEPNENGSEWLLRRDEFVALNTWQIQKLKARVAALEALVK